ncbi:transposase [Sinorhizobium meliloti]|nr:transposase [Sinorhizobium meliloti]
MGCRLIWRSAVCTKMTDTDWANALEVCLPRRGRKAADDRLFLEAMHFFAVEICVGVRCRNASAIGIRSGSASRPPAQKREKGQALGRSRGGFTKNTHAKADKSGGIIAFDLTGEPIRFKTLLHIGPDITLRAALGHTNYSSKANRAAARARGIAPVIPHKANEKNAPAFARTLYKARARIEQGFGRLKRFMRVALRREKTARNFRSIISFVSG